MTQIMKDIVNWLKQWYYTEAEVDALLNGKSNTNHSHNIFNLDLTSPSGCLTLEEGVDSNSEGLGYADSMLVYNQQDSKIFYNTDGGADYEPSNELATLGDIPAFTVSFGLDTVNEQLYVEVV